MLKKLIWNDVRQNKLLSAATVFFMAVSAMMLALTALLFSTLLGSVGALMEQARVPDLLQMHTGELNKRTSPGLPENVRKSANGRYAGS